MAINNYASLKTAIANLPPPPTDHVRVFRGQTTDYPKILPSGLRGSVRKRVIWQVYSQHLHLDLLPGLIGPTGDVSHDLLQAIPVWLKAVAQHYGPGSDFVDVTTSLDVALWFALHSLEAVKAEGASGPPGPFDPERDHLTLNTFYRYEPWNEEAYLYVLDLPKWNGEGIAEPGTVVDLADAPEVFSSSPRMRAQHGCLVNCRGKDSEAIDLKSFLVPGTPIPISLPMTGAPGLNRSVAEMFPSPAVDEWYARFLSVPMTYSPTPQPPKLQPPIPVSIYFDEHNKSYMDEVLYRGVSLPLPLLHRALPDFERKPTGGNAEGQEKPIPIILEAPMVFPYPPGDSQDWHHGLLASDLPDHCPYYEFGSDTADATDSPKGEIPLTDILIEFSQLEHTGWERIVKENLKFTMLRAIWLRREADNISVAYINHTIPGPSPEILGFFSLVFDQASQRWFFEHPEDQAQRIPITEDAQLAKPILVALMILRHLSPAIKVDATPRLAVGTDEEKQILVNCAGAAARLYKVESPYCNWYVLRDENDPQEPFSHVTNPTGGIQFTAHVPFCDYPTDQLRVKAHDSGQGDA